MRSVSWPDLLPFGLAAVAEAAWIGALYAFVQILWGGGRLVLDVPQLTLAAAAGIGLGLVAGRERRPGGARRGWAAAAMEQGPASAPRGPAILSSERGRVALAMSGIVLVGAVGWLADPEARSALAAFDPATALSRHPGGWLAGLATLRGLVQASAAGDEEGGQRALATGLPALVALWLLATRFGPEQRAAFGDRALPDTVAFMVAGLVGLGVTGIRAASRGVDVDWRSNRQWLGLLAAVVALMVLVAVPALFVVGRPLVETLLSILWVIVELVVLVVVVRAVPRAIAFALPFLVGGLVILALLRLVGFRPSDLAAVAGQISQALQVLRNPSDTGASGGQVALFGLAVAVVGLVAIALLVRYWLGRRAATIGGAVFEERSVLVERGTLRLRRPRFGPGRTARPPEPTDAVSAYMAVLRGLEPDPGLRRSAGESPAEHAGRLEAWAAGSMPLRRLAIDYELARFGGRRLRGREEERALDRWRRLRDLVRQRPRTAPAGEGNELEAGARPRPARRRGDETPRF